MNSETAGKEKLAVLEEIVSHSKEIDWEKLTGLTAGEVAYALGISRNLASQYLNEWVRAGRMVKVNSRPAYFVDSAGLPQGAPQTFDTVAALRQAVAVGQSASNPAQADANHPNAIFEELIGWNSSLAGCIEQCCAAISYPPDGLPILLNGPTGTGKSMLAQMIFHYAVSRNLIEPDKKFLAINCSEYANNPELIASNLFGYSRGAFTGAERDTSGLLSLADGGVLFLDEVHCLKSECQEKLFQFMDKGVFHRVGDNGKWYHSQVRLIFATTENPQKVLLRTLLRRIPIVVSLPSLNQRPLEERKELLSGLLQREAEAIHTTVTISRRAYQAMMQYPFAGNVGELKNCVRVCCANAFLNRAQKARLEIHSRHLPAELQNYFEKHAVDVLPGLSGYEVLDLSGEVMHGDAKSVPVLALFDGLLQAMENGTFDATENALFTQYLDKIVFIQATVPVPEQAGHTLLEELEMFLERQGISLHHNELLILSHMLADYSRSTSLLKDFFALNQHRLLHLGELLKEKWNNEYETAARVVEWLKFSMDFSTEEPWSFLLAVFLHTYRQETKRDFLPCVIIAHGYSTASSIADTANRLLGRFVFEAIDVPLGSGKTDVAAWLNSHFGNMSPCRQAVLLVDMGSLEGISIGLPNLERMDLGIINNVNTRLAVDIGSMALEGCGLKTILEKASSLNVCNYYIVNGKKQEDAIAVICSTGKGTSQKVADLLKNSFPKPLEIQFVPEDYESFNQYGSKAPDLQQYHILFVVCAGPLQAKAKDLPLIQLDGLIEKKNTDRMHQLLSKYLDEAGWEQFRQNILKEFSLENLLGELTILNPDKLLDCVNDALNSLQKCLGWRFQNGTIIGLSVHVGCLIERLVKHQQMPDRPDMDSFRKQDAKLIKAVKESFQKIESYYGIDLPDSEIVYIKDFIQNDRRYADCPAEGTSPHI
ncbi:MAG: sigma 54-interacting transcriptional regulator [Faecalibacterium sp.]|nr:sigma 54-interacting transcriptional regulator [Faecalibacterium sp.]